MPSTPQNIHELKRACRYIVRRDFTDFYRNPFRQGEVLTFMELHFLPYHGGYTVVFEERQLYLQEEENADILNSIGMYLSLVSE